MAVDMLIDVEAEPEDPTRWHWSCEACSIGWDRDGTTENEARAQAELHSVTQEHQARAKPLLDLWRLHTGE
jgi:hypothetical protein